MHNVFHFRKIIDFFKYSFSLQGNRVYLTFLRKTSKEYSVVNCFYSETTNSGQKVESVFLTQPP